MNLFKRLLLLTGISQPVAFHTYWSAPNGGKPLPFQEYELLSLVAGPILWRARCGSEFWLFTDKTGYDDLHARGLLGVYDRIEFLDEEPLKGINPKVFWAAGKIQAYRQAPVPFVSMDFDAYVKRPFWKSPLLYPANVMPLNAEPIDWECYRRNKDNFVEWFDKADFDWSVPPYNVGVLGIFSESFRKLYTETSMKFMASVSSFNRNFRPYVDYSKQSGGYKYFEEQVFAEQRLLGLLAAKYWYSLKPIGKFSRESDHLTPNNYAVHLWSSKHGFNWHKDARQFWAQNLLRKLYSVSCERCWYTIMQVGMPWIPVVEENSGELMFTKPEDKDFSGYKPSLPTFKKDTKCLREYCMNRGRTGA